MSQKEIDILKRALNREKLARKQAEQILEDKSKELYSLAEELRESNEKLEELVSESSSELKGVFQNLVDAYILIDLNWNVIKMNTSASNLVGEENNSEAINAFEFIHVDEQKNAKKAFNTLLEKGSVSNFITRVRPNDKDIDLVSINVSLIYNKNNQPIGAQAIIRDITLETRYNNNLEAQKQKYTNVIANMNLGLIEVDLEDRIVMINSSFEKMSGYSEEEIIGKKGKELLVPEEQHEFFDKKVEKRVDGISESYEVQVLDKKGRKKNWLISGAPNYDNSGKLVGSIGIHLDITELKKLEKQKEILLAQLETSNNELQEYAHIVSHDLKSPLRNIHALLSWIKEEEEGNLKENSLTHIDLIENSLEKMETLITDILNYSSVTSDGKDDQLVDINSLIEELHKIIIVPENVKIIFLTELPNLRGNRVRFQQVFQNLIGNSIHYMDKEQGLIKVGVEEIPGFYKFSISDNGIGIEEKNFEKVFKIFQSLTERKGSSGIGLTIVKKIIDHYQGEIWLESEYGVGTTFYFTIRK